MNRIRRAFRYLSQPRVLRAIGLAYALGLILSIGIAWAIAVFVRMQPTSSSAYSALEGSEHRTVNLQRTPFSMTVEVIREPIVNWSPDQAAGAPNTWKLGDIVTAWASSGPDDQDEWLELDYSPPVDAQRVLIHETYNPHAVSSITAIDETGAEYALWRGNDPAAPTTQGIFVADIPIRHSKPISRLRLNIDSKRVAGWNEIDAVGLVDPTGTTHWATGARASSTYATNGGPQLRFDELVAKVPYWVETDAYRYGRNGIAYEAHGWPFLTVYGQSPNTSGASVPIRPIRPIWPGLLANGAIYGVVLWLFYLLVTAPRRFVRQSLWLRRGCCMECGYDLQFDLARGCPECGWRRTRVA